MPDSYFPYAQYLYDYVKKHAPQAEIVIQQTWSYRCDDGRFGNGQWKITQKQMYEKLSDAYAKAAEKLGTRRIPSGLAVEKAREMQPHSTSPPTPPPARRSCRPDLPPQAGAVVGNFYWKKNPKTGELELKNDSIHLSNRGQYLQACVWYGFLFGKDPKDIKYVPDSIGDKDAEMLRNAAFRRPQRDEAARQIRETATKGKSRPPDSGRLFFARPNSPHTLFFNRHLKRR